VQVLGQIDDGAASRTLVMLAVFGGSPGVRRQATETLRQRDAREFGSMLIALIRQPIEYEVKRVQGPGQGGELLIKGQGSAPNLKRLYSPPSTPPIANLQPGDRVVYDQNGLPVIVRPEALMYEQTRLGQLAASAQQLDQATVGTLTNFVAQSGLNGPAQKVINTMIGNLNASINNLAHGNYLNSGVPLVQLAALAPSGVAPNPQSLITFGYAVSETIPVGLMALEAQKTAVLAEQQLEKDVAAIKEYNQGLSQINDRVLPVLTAVSGLDLGPKPLEWQKWYVDLIGYRLNQMQSNQNNTVIEDVPLAYQPQPIPVGQFASLVSVVRMSCFGAGTLVQTLTGLEPIETLKIGDPVLTQSTKTGALAYKPIVAVHHNPPSKTFHVKLGGETIVSSEFHRFWKAGQGWVMARDLKQGDLIRTLDGTKPVTSIERGEVVLVYNLDVAEDADFFVGHGGILVHDNTLPDLREKPFDAVGPLTADAVSDKPARPRSMLGQ
jgi:hypothetical protein